MSRREVEGRLKRLAGASEATKARVAEASAGLPHWAWCRICKTRIAGTPASLKAHVHKQEAENAPTPAESARTP